MKKGLIFWMLLVALAALFIVGCGNSDDENPDGNQIVIDDPSAITGAMADWLIAFMPDDAKMENAIMMTYLKATGMPLPTDVVELLIDGVSAPVEMFEGVPGLYFGTYDLVPGTTYQVVFKINGVQKVSTSLKMVYNVQNFTAPQTYVVGAPADIGWTLTGNNQYQYAGVSAYKDNYPAEPTTDDYFVQVGVSARNYTILANAVDDLGAGTSYDLGVTEVNYNITSRVAVMSFHSAFQMYGGNIKTAEPIEIYNKAISLYKAVNK